MDEVMPLFERQISMDSPADCPLCSEHMPSLRYLLRHLGKHLEELSLFALPSELRDDDDDDDTIEQSSIAAERSMSLSPVYSESEASGSGASNDEDAVIHIEPDVSAALYDQSHVSKSQIMDAKALLLFKPTVIQTMDMEIFDRNLLNACHDLKSLQLPGTVRTWNQLKQWHAQQPSGVTGTAIQLDILQAIQFNSLLVTQEAGFYFNELAKFHDKRSAPRLSERNIYVMNKFVPLHHICTVIRAHCSSETINKNASWIEVASDLGFDSDVAPDAATYMKVVYDHYQTLFMEYLTQADLGWDDCTSPAAKDQVSKISWEVKVNDQDDVSVQQATLSLHATHVALYSMVPGPLRIAQFHNIECSGISDTITIHETMELKAAFCAERPSVETVKRKLVITAGDATVFGEIKRRLSVHKPANEPLLLRSVSNTQAAQQSLRDREVWAQSLIASPGLAVFEVRVKGIVDISIEQMCTLEIHHGSLVIYGSVVGTAWRIFRGNIHSVRTGRALVGVRGWLDHKGSPPQLARVELFFDEVQDANSVFAEIDYARDKTLEAQPAPWRPSPSILRNLWKY
jgi:hypothetical protein